MPLRSVLQGLAQPGNSATADCETADLPAFTATTLVEAFRNSSSRHPERRAVISEDDCLSYAELDRWSDALAARLQSAGVRSGDRVALHLEASPAWLAAMLAVLKAGACYVPVDPANPQSRKSHIVADSGVVAVIGNTLEFADLAVRPIEIDAHALVEARSAEPDRSIVQPEVPAGQDAYIIYTSGTTGVAKGVPITHANATALLAATRTYVFDERDVWLLFHSVAFDFSVWEIWGAFAYGGALVIPATFVKQSPRECAELIATAGVTVLNQTPSAYRGLQPELLADTAAGRPAPVTSLRYVIFGGEALDVADILPSIRSSAGRIRYVNMYGITETTVHASYCPVTDEDPDRSGHSPIGELLPGFTALVVDERLEPVPSGQVGELLLGGPQVSRGYLNRSDLTAQRFPLIGEPTAQVRYYRTGDLVRRTATGYRYVGRNDDQIKLRGHRIELGEVEFTIRRHADIDAAVAVVVDVDGIDDKRLVCVYSTRSGAAIAKRELRAFADSALPVAMRPAGYIWVPAVERTANGKTDRATSKKIAEEYFDARRPGA